MENLHLKNLKNNGKITIKKITRYLNKQGSRLIPEQTGYQKPKDFNYYLYPPKLIKTQEWVNNQTLIIYYNYCYEKEPKK